ncbi:hypothetical protein PK69_09365 [Xanthomonas phaseoli pv. phaseoli]|uniref:Uncharacterized protein n=1 Tax=Xanthomonas campestris pv. phaseoli TaxID=317013 RepID=A0AB34QLJ2_XANCH|nr:hypothetical protein AC609_19930 [Xanthomonas phaseoli pv. phaseoli]AZU32557.1 hypothetical protein AC801_23225 [Xanthomonas sp. ISO98C4]KUF37044.1 hypothetical protein AO826_19565 [Xanthomonas phaseoli pv. manihotis]AZU27667.1 hypothetical protein AC611_19950 [Xanthomonas phaseoli pv. phaseoli]AZU36432.1 hypothetical protein AC610_19920 [Xanthomonas phaseoli pv. phaseoli]
MAVQCRPFAVQRQMDRCPLHRGACGMPQKDERCRPPFDQR